MKNLMIIPMIIMVILLTGACKSKPAPAPREPAAPTTQVPAATTTTPATTAPAAAAPATTTPGTTTQPAYGAGAGTTTTPAATTGSRHSSGIILDGATTYIVVSGDTMSGIARRFYQDGSLYPLIMMVSPIVADIDQIDPGMTLTVPALAVNMNDATARQSLNRYLLQIAPIEDQRGRPQTAAMMRNHAR